MTEFDKQYKKLYDEWLEKSIELARLEKRMEELRFGEEKRRHLAEMSENERMAFIKYRHERRMKKLAICTNV